MSEVQLHDKVPGFAEQPIHRSVIESGIGSASVVFNEVPVTDSAIFSVVPERGQEPIVNFPPEHAAMVLLFATVHDTYCPFKGEASCCALSLDGHSLEHPVWSYNTIYQETLALAGLMAFHAEQDDAVRAGSE